MAYNAPPEQVRSLVTVRSAVKDSLGLLDPESRRRWHWVVIAQVSTGILDLVGVLLIGAVGAVAASAASGDAVPPVALPLLDLFGARGANLESILLVLTVLAAFFFVAKSWLYAVVLYRVYRFLANRQSEVSGALAARLFSAPLESVQRLSTQDTTFAIVNGSFAAVTLVLGSYVVVLSELVLMALLGVALLIIDPLATTVAVIFFAALGLLLQKFLSVRAAVQGSIVTESTVGASTVIQEGIFAYREVSVLGRRGYLEDSARTALTARSHAFAQLNYVGQLPRLAYEAALIIGALALGGLTFLVSGTADAVATLALFLVAGSRLMPSLLRMNGHLIALRGSAAQVGAVARLTEWETRNESTLTPSRIEPESPDREGSTRSERSSLVPSVSLNSVYYAFPGASTPAVRNVSLEVPPGSHVALVGSTGAGKSTLADLIMGVLTPTSGRVRVGGDLPTEVSERRPGFLAYVPQSVMMVNGTVRDNVALALPLDQIDDQRVWEALRKAAADDFLQQSREGLETVIGERGLALSGGQKQRIGLARALYARPHLLLMDEATSALDAETEDLVTAAVASLRGEVTLITIAHRLSTITQADMVVYMEDGAIAAAGTFDEVRRQNVRFDRQAGLLGIGAE